VEAALLIENIESYEKNLNELWVTFVPKDEALKRQLERPFMSEEKAMSIINSQITNKDRLLHANVILSSLWSREYTIKQVKKAYSQLLKRTIEE
jgi:phosphopantetheine adenylyltransferase / dephospho-CoA kinase